MKQTAVPKNELLAAGLTEALRSFLAGLLQSGQVAAVLAPKRAPDGRSVAQMLIAEPDRLQGLDPLAPVQMVNAAQVVRELAREPLEQKIACLLRPCELRAVVELAKLKQLNLESLYLVGYDCPGACDLKDYLDWLEQGDEADALRSLNLQRFLEEAEGREPAGDAREPAGGSREPAGKGREPAAEEPAGKGREPAAEEPAGGGSQAPQLRSACRLCSRFTAEGADLNAAWIGAQAGELCIVAGSERGRALLAEDQAGREAPAGRAALVEALRARRLRLQEEPPRELLGLLKACIRCYNCREVCPICYCKECLLKPEKMGYSSQRYLSRAQKKGQIKMPVDTLLYHLTKMNHMACSCVACGLCEQACPMDIPLGSIYSRVGRKVQALFDYVPGRSLEEELPVTTFREDELPEVEDLRR